MCGNEGLSKHINVATALEAVVDAPIRQLPDHLVDGLAARLRVDEIRDAHLFACNVHVTQSRLAVPTATERKATPMV